MAIKKTMDYDMFQRLPGNRDISRNLVNKLHKSVLEKNLLHLRPIIVDQDMRVIDGQHRLEVARTLEVPIYYIREHTNINDVVLLNTNQQEWTLNTYISSYARRGFPEYKTLQSFMNTYGLTATVAGNLLSGGKLNRAAEASLRRSMKDGTFEVSSLDEANELVELLISLQQYCDGTFWRTREFLVALRLVFEKGFREALLERLEKRAETGEWKMKRCVSTMDYLRQFEGVLSFGMKKNKVRLY